MKGYKGYKKGLICRDKQYAENTTFEENDANICVNGMHFCALPHQTFEYYDPANSEFTVVDADDADTDDKRKYCTKKLHVGAKISVFEICKISVSAFFERFDFKNKIKNAESNYAGDYGAANAGDCGAANAGYRGAANAGNCGAANAGYRGAANAGNYGAANAGDCGAANAGDCGAANAGNCGAAIVRKNGKASVSKQGVAIAFNGKAKGAKGSVLVLIESDGNDNIKKVKAIKVTGRKIKADTYYKLEDGKIVEAGDEK